MIYKLQNKFPETGSTEMNEKADLSFQFLLLRECVFSGNVYLCVCVYVCMYVCVYICIYIYIYICMYVYTHIYNERPSVSHSLSLNVFICQKRIMV